MLSFRKARYQFLLNSFLKMDLEADHLVVPTVTEAEFESICQDAADVFADEPIVLDLFSPLVVVGDIHGQLSDMIRIARERGPGARLLFLGDIVDRGPFSFECALFLFLLKLCRPLNVYLTRGNHEFLNVCGDIQEKARLMSVFSFAPLCAVVDNEVFCVHGGIGPNVVRIDELRMLRRPMPDCSADTVTEMLWSDPTDECAGFRPSGRGVGFEFGQAVVDEFLRTNNLKRIVRAHQYVPGGIVEHFEGKVVTVFSSSDYLGRHNKGKVFDIMPPKRKGKSGEREKPKQGRSQSVSNRPIQRIVVGDKRMLHMLTPTPPGVGIPRVASMTHLFEGRRAKVL